MGFAEILLLSDGLGASSSSPLIQCKICHEEEEESSTAMESPCSCSGSLKFAHRGCIQRWCDEKRSTVCEICLEKFEPGYTIPPKISHLVDVVVTIRASLEVPRLNYDPRASISDTESDEGSGNDHAECSLETGRRASHCRFVAIMVTIMLLIQHLIIVFTAGPDHYTLALTTVFLIRAGGILLPFLLVMRLISAIQRNQRQQWRWQQIHTSSEETEDSTTDRDEVHEDRRIQHHSIQINS